VNKNRILLGLGSILILLLSACGDPGVKVAEEKSNSTSDDVDIATVESDTTEQDADGETVDASDDAPTDTTNGTTSGPDDDGVDDVGDPPGGDDSGGDGNEGGDTSDSTSTDDTIYDDTEVATLASLVGFYVTNSQGDIYSYAGITPDGVLTDYTYDEAGNCYIPSSSQITDRGEGVFWVQDGDIINEIRLAVRDGNLILFSQDINEPGRIVYPGTTAVSQSDLQLCS